MAAQDSTRTLDPIREGEDERIRLRASAFVTSFHQHHPFPPPIMRSFYVKKGDMVLHGTHWDGRGATPLACTTRPFRCSSDLCHRISQESIFGARVWKVQRKTGMLIHVAAGTRACAPPE